jgi:serine phosphatase RsbU (regulator of sigma subunit)
LSSRDPGVPAVVSELLAAVVELRGDFVGIFSPVNEAVYLNDHGHRLVESGALTDAHRRSFFDFFAPEDHAFVREVALAEVGRLGRWSGTLRLRNMRTGMPIAVELEIFRLPALAADRPYFAAIARDLSARLRSEARSRTLLDAGAALSHTLEYDDALVELAKLVVRRLASYCLVDVFAEANGRREIRRVATYHIDRAKRDLVASLADFIPDVEQYANPVVAAYRDGGSTLVTDVDEAWILRASMSPEHAEILRALGVRSWLTVPLVAHGKLLGALTCVIAQEQAHRLGFLQGYDAEDLFLVEELGRRAGAAIENARLYEYQRNIAVTLQAASLPVSLPRIDHMRLAADYRPGDDEATIGGDWFDAFELADGRVILSVGDVLGHGLHAAVAMTKLRQAMQGAAMVEADPRLMLRVADATLLLHDPNGFATALAAVFDPATHTLTYASAGHPGPLLRHPDGRVEDLPSSGLLLGVRSGADRMVRSIEMPANCTVLLFTDGLVEATRDVAEGHRRLSSALAKLDIERPNPARDLVDAVLEGKRASDDIAVLCVRIAPPSAPEEPAMQSIYAGSASA